MKPALILDRSWKWIGADTHSDPSLFAARMAERVARVRAEQEQQAARAKAGIVAIKRKVSA